MTNPNVATGMDTNKRFIQERAAAPLTVQVTADHRQILEAKERDNAYDALTTQITTRP